MTVTIRDDFDLDKIALSGQCFRVGRPGGAYQFIHGRNVLILRHAGGMDYDASCGEAAWDTVWRRYFDLDRDYAALRARHECDGPYVRAALNYGRGLRVLRQDPWEMLITFILSQRKSIPAISGCVEALARRWGDPIDGPAGTVYAFPTPRQLRRADEAALRAMGLGYRAPYVADAAARVCDDEAFSPERLGALDDQGLIQALYQLRGVGAKVARCVALFGYGRTACAPIDVWIGRAIDTQFGGRSPFDDCGGDAGLIQQYIFYYIRQTARGGRHEE